MFREGERMGDDIFGANDEYAVPEAIKKFVVTFQKYVRDRNVYEILNQYEFVFQQLVEQFFKASAWPTAQLIAGLVDNDEIFLYLYKELYYRHIYANRDLTQTIGDRFDSFENYMNIFNILLDQSDEMPVLDLPSQWIWDMVYEFVCQYQEFHAYRNMIQELPDEEVTMLMNNPDVWNTSTVLRFLHALVNKGGIYVSFMDEGEQNTSARFNPAKISHAAGCFSLVGLSYLHLLQGDYQTALELLDPMDIQKRALISRVLSCHMVINYVMGTSYMMLRRTDDAIWTFSSVLSVAAQITLPATFMYDTVSRMIASMQVLLAVCISVFPTPIDEKLLASLRELYAEEMAAIISGSEETMLKMLAAGAPRFISAGVPDYEHRLPTNIDTFELQLRVFQHEMVHIRKVVRIYDFLKLYTSIPLTKLAVALDLTDAKLISQLIMARNTMRNLKWKSGPPSSGELESSSSLDFYVQDGVVHVVKTKHEPKYRDELIHGINKLEEMLVDLARIGA